MTDTLHTRTVDLSTKRAVIHAAISTKDGEKFSLMIANMTTARFKLLVKLENLTAQQVENRIEAFKFSR